MNLSPEQFRDRFPEFSSSEKFPDAQIEIFLSDAQCELRLPSACEKPYYLLAAHLLKTRQNALKDEAEFGMTTSASVGSVSVSQEVPKLRSAWQAWLAGTPYGQELWAWLSLKSVGGWIVGGLPERSAFRKVGGVFW
jgi:hypothetical protein